ncbi:MAG: divergent PAP2 family protein [Candidatus Phytoplasma sp.]|nr:divergent PAP2 family protein [Phytoplasma sp.]
MNDPIKIILISILSMVIAQVIKFFISGKQNKKLDEKVLFSTGGMPSSHSALVTSLVTAIFIYEGMSIFFAIALVLAMVVVHDSMGIRYEASKHAQDLNKIKERLNQDDNQAENVEKLKESLGHKPKEVFFGILLGIAVAVIGWLFLG